MGKSVGGIYIIYVLLISALAFFEYGRTAAAAVGGLLLALLFVLISLFGFIPLIGLLIYWFAANWLLGWWSQFTGFSANTFTASVAFWFATIGTIVVNIIITLAVLLLILSNE
jgi:hypothetical protein